MIARAFSCVLLLTTFHSPQVAHAEPPGRDALGDPLPAQAVARLGTIRLRHAGSVDCAVFVNDGKYLLSFGADNVLRTWDAANGAEVRQQRLDREPAAEGRGWGAAALSSSGRLLAVIQRKSTESGTYSLQLHDGATGKLVRAWLVRDAGWQLDALAFSPDDRLLAAGGANGQVYIWESATGASKPCGKMNAMVTALTFAHDGATLAAGDGVDGVCLWDVATGKPRRWLQERGPGFLGKNSFHATLAFTPDGKSLVSGNSDAAARLWDIGSGKEIRRFTALQTTTDRHHPDCLNSVLVSGDGQTLYTENDNGMIESWELATGKKRWQTLAHRRRNSLGSGPALTLAPDGKTLASWGWESTIRLWNDEGQERAAVPAHRGAVTGLVFNPDGKHLLACSNECQVQRWEAATARCIWTTRYSDYRDVRQVACAPDGQRFVMTGYYGHALVGEVATGRDLAKLDHADKLGNWTEATSYSPDGKLVAISGDHRVCLFEPQTLRPVRVLEMDQSVSRIQIAFSSDGRYLVGAASAYRAVGPQVWGFEQEFRYFGFVQLLEVATGKALKYFQNEVEPLKGVACAPDGRTVATVSETGTLSLWETATGQERQRLKGRGAVCFAPDGRTLAAGGADGAIRLWDMTTGQELPARAGHRGRITALAFSPDGAILASGSTDTTILLWDMKNVQRPRAPERVPTAAELETLWIDLAGADAARAFESVRRLAAAPAQTTPFLAKRLESVRADAQRIQRWLLDLTSDRFAVREQAAAELMNLGQPACAALAEELTKKPPLEVQQRIEQILTAIEHGAPQGRAAQGVRAVEVLGKINSAEARAVLQRLATGDPAVRLTQEAKAALDLAR